jgi:hypothetical protein
LWALSTLVNPRCCFTFIELGGNYFDEFWRCLTEIEQNLLLRLLTGESVQASDRVIIQKLTQIEVLEVENGDRVRFQVPLIERYLATTQL